jgi:Flp pilus assembly protein TadB
MRLINLIFGFSKFFPRLNLSFSSAEVLKQLEPSVDPRKYVAASFFLSSLLAFVAFIVFFLSDDINSAIIASALTFSFFAFIFIKLPEIEFNRYMNEVEADLPPALRMLGMFVNFGIPFHNALALVADEQTPLGIELRKIVKDANAGVAISRTISQFAERTKSQPFKRALAQLLSCYEHGQSGKEISAIGDELLAVQQHRFRDAATRSSTFGLLFVASSVLLPTFFIIIAVLSQPLLSAPISEETFILALTLFFPVVSVFVLLLAKLSLPLMLFRRERKIDWRVLFAVCIIVITAIFLQQPYNYGALLIGFLILSFSLYKTYKKEKRKEQIEAVLPDALFAIASLPKGSTVEKIFRVIEKGNYGPLSEEASISLRQLGAGVKPEAALEDFGKRSDSEIVKRVCMMLIYAINTNSLDRLSDVAEDVLKFVEILRERSALLSMQKYTLLFGGFIIPAILKMALSLLTSMRDFLSPSSLLFIQLAERIIPVYIVIYGFLASYYISEIEEKESLFPLYFIVIGAAGLIIFSFLTI